MERLARVSAVGWQELWGEGRDRPITGNDGQVDGNKAMIGWAVESVNLLRGGVVAC